MHSVFTRSIIMRFEGNVLVINVKEGGGAQLSMLPQSSSRCCREITTDNNQFLKKR